MVVLRCGMYAHGHCGRSGEEMRESAVFTGLLIANILVAALFRNGDWPHALEVSYFEGLALLTHWICRKIDHE